MRIDDRKLLGHDRRLSYSSLSTRRLVSLCSSPKQCGPESGAEDPREGHYLEPCENTLWDDEEAVTKPWTGKYFWPSTRWSASISGVGHYHRDGHDCRENESESEARAGSVGGCGSRRSHRAGSLGS